jgi:hypothetical protein
MASFSRIYAQMVTVLRLLVASFAVMSVSAQTPAERPPRFEDYPVKDVFKGTPASLVLKIPEEWVLKDVFSDGVTNGWGVFDGVTGKEFQRPGVNFAGHYVLVNFGCGQTDGHCLGAAIVDVHTGRVYRPPVPDIGEAWRTYFGVLATRSLAPHPAFSLHNFPIRSPLAYRRDSRLVIADICEGADLNYGPPDIVPYELTLGEPKGCGAHYYLMDDDGLHLIQRIVE